MYHTKKIGVFISHIMGDYQRNVCQGIINKSLEYGYTAEIFTTLDGENLGDYGIGEESILRMPNYEDFSGIIFASETYPLPALKEQIYHTLQEKCTCPVVEIAVTNPKFPSIALENNVTTYALTSHLIEVHHYSKICYLGCSTEPYFSDQRKEYYCSALNDHGYAVLEENIYCCDYSNTDASAALSYFLSSGSKPDAVVCYNDRMALLFMMAALNAGYQIPADIAITGCDCTLEGTNATPALTTVSFPVYELGTNAVEVLIKLIHNENVSSVTTILAEPIWKNSCGCQNVSDKNAVFFGQTLHNRIVSLESSILSSMRMSAAFQRVTDIDDGMDILAEYITGIEHCSEFYLCLYSGWDALNNPILELTSQNDVPESNPNEILLKLGIRNGKRLAECSFLKKSLLPEHIYQALDSAYIYTPLFFENREFGYIALAYEQNHIDYHFQLVHWFMNISQMLQSICEANHASQLTERLKDYYSTDPLTGLYNSHGFQLYESELVNHTSGALDITEFIFEFVKLDEIIGTYGHLEGDFSLQVIAQALQSVAKKTDICAHTKDHEFRLLTAGCTKKDAENLIARVTNYLDHYNRFSHKDYDILVTGSYAPLFLRSQLHILPILTR